MKLKSEIKNQTKVNSQKINKNEIEHENKTKM